MNIDDLCDVEVDGIYMDDYPDFCDAYIVSATWVETGKPLTDPELDELNKTSVVYDAVMKYLY